MIFAIGKPGERARIHLRTQYREDADRQLQPGEVVVEVDEVSPVTINAKSIGVERLLPTATDHSFDLRSRRGALLSASDWTQAADAPLTPKQRAEWAAYRKALRDLPETESGKPVAAVNWPTPPKMEAR